MVTVSVPLVCHGTSTVRGIGQSDTVTVATQSDTVRVDRHSYSEFVVV